MPFKFSTINLTEDPPDFDLHSPPASWSSTICLPLNSAGCSFIKSKTSCQVAAGASLRLAKPASNFGCWSPSESIQCPEEGRLKSETKKVGKGGFSCVYEGLLGNGSRVAIKRLTRHPALGLILRAEVKLGNMIWHRNLLPVHGFCLSSKHGEYTLVYTFMVNGSLDSLLRGQSTKKPSLDWPTRKKIAIGAARGISHLHDLRIIHRDIKPANILSDEDFEARIGDFGLALFMDDHKEKAVSVGEPNGEDAYFISSTMGTIGYMDLGSFSGRYSVKSDVYGFGMTLLELISGRSNEKLETLVDTNMPGGYNESEVEKTVRLALLCTQFNPIKRPYMAEAVLYLRGIISLEERWEEYQTDATMQSGKPNLDSSSSDSTSCHSEEELSGGG
ncbi:hypothetical protein EUGRSUZ_A02281 [Eucalyptus grandis]|uniref:Uncharacterized protein n=2 Tax=Eucalyptus grandis TaxID=71139 RepID=A0ACC3M612_EUCGR|nr:hypothetical protein EUGRSUZ_A02281 [Eucalyptus grandis]